MVGRPEVLSQSLQSFRYRLSVVYQKSLNVWSRTVMCTGQRFEFYLLQILCGLFKYSSPFKHCMVLHTLKRVCTMWFSWLLCIQEILVLFFCCCCCWVFFCFFFGGEGGISSSLQMYFLIFQFVDFFYWLLHIPNVSKVSDQTLKVDKWQWKLSVLNHFFLDNSFYFNWKHHCGLLQPMANRSFYPQSILELYSPKWWPKPTWCKK